VGCGGFGQAAPLPTHGTVRRSTSATVIISTCTRFIADTLCYAKMNQKGKTAVC
jgi:hypothetical protein